MTYLALARKWRPGKFEDVVGQPHVVAALTHALDNDRVHHAFLFTGTRGVGKTTLARLLAKSLNCERGVSSTPCGECGACVSVEQGRFVDLLEIDAASRTRVDDTREILDNVQYAPTMGRYKVYLVDEVHMLSTHSFNALLKTLEEPPPHVKFLLATTDPRKLPATILSRCLQFNLRALHVDEIAGQLRRVLEAENMEAEGEALELLSRAADGSMRDALSLLDQAIAFSGQALSGDSVRRMLGMIEGSQIVELLDCLVGNDTTGMFGLIDRMRDRSINFTRALDDLLILLHEIAIALEAPELAQGRDSPWNGQLDIAARMKPEQVQLYYQIVLIGKRDLPLAPDPARGFEMVMLRMLAFDPALPPEQQRAVRAQLPGAPSQPTIPAARVAGRPASPVVAPARSASVVAEDIPASGPATQVSGDVKKSVPRSTDGTANNVAPGALSQAVEPLTEAAPVKLPVASQAQAAGVPDAVSWARFAESGVLSGLMRELAMNLEFDRIEGTRVYLRLDEALGNLLKRNRVDGLERKAKSCFGEEFGLEISMIPAGGEANTPAARRELRLREEREQAIDGLRTDPEISTFINQFDAEIVPESVVPANQRGK